MIMMPFWVAVPQRFGLSDADHPSFGNVSDVIAKVTLSSDRVGDASMQVRLVRICWLIDFVQMHYNWMDIINVIRDLTPISVPCFGFPYMCYPWVRYRHFRGGFLDHFPLSFRFTST